MLSAQTCPRCDLKLISKNDFSHCSQYHGILLNLVDFKKNTSPTFVQKCWKKWIHLTNKKSFKCPCCSTRMINLNYDSKNLLELDCCPNCYAIWLDDGEFNILKNQFEAVSPNSEVASHQWAELARSLLLHQNTIDRYKRIQKLGKFLNQPVTLRQRLSALIG